jgi:hypothetical protein
MAAHMALVDLSFIIAIPGGLIVKHLCLAAKMNVSGQEVT